jgi:hypothetical protein
MYILNEDKTYRKAVDTHEFEAQFNTMNRQIADTKLPNKRISTTWLGVDHNYYKVGGGVVLIFETMVLDSEGKSECQQLYSSWEDAIKGHEMAVHRICIEQIK